MHVFQKVFLEGFGVGALFYKVQLVGERVSEFSVKDINVEVRAYLCAAINELQGILQRLKIDSDNVLDTRSER